MQRQQTPCATCHKPIDSAMLPLHTLMCSTSHLRGSRLRLSKPNPNQPILCIHCMQSIPVHEYQYHYDLGCKHRLVPCIDCDGEFPLSLWQEHREVCGAGSKAKQQQHEGQGQGKQDQEGSESAIAHLMAGVGLIGSTLYSKASKFVAENKQPALKYLHNVRDRLAGTIEDLFMSLAHEQHIEGMSRTQIRRIPTKLYTQAEYGPQLNCTICFCQLQPEQQIKQLRCRHVYHPTCITQWLRINRTCPLCKMDQLAQ